MIEINARPKNTGNPIKDFSSAIEEEGYQVKIGEHYKMGSSIVSFYSGRGNLVGIDIFRLQREKDGLYYQTRIQPNLKRVEMGFVKFF